MSLDIIVPFKDAVHHLPKLCLDLEGQQHQDFTVYFVSDHSEDGSIEYLGRNFSFRHVILHSDAEGPGSARNKGIRESRGDYVLFIDADDRINKNYTFRFSQKALGTNADIIECMYHAIDQSGIIVSRTNIESYISSEDRFISLALGEVPRLSWGKAFSRRLIEDHEVYFPEGIHNGEDHVFLLNAYKASKKIELIHDFLYSWIRHPASLTNRPATQKTVEDFVKVTELKYNIFSSYRSMQDECSEEYLRFARRTFKEARVLINKLVGEGNKDLASRLVNLLTRSEELSSLCEAVKADRKTSYWEDVVGAK